MPPTISIPKTCLQLHLPPTVHPDLSTLPFSIACPNLQSPSHVHSNPCPMLVSPFHPGPAHTHLVSFHSHPSQTTRLPTPYLPIQQAKTPFHLDSPLFPWEVDGL